MAGTLSTIGQWAPIVSAGLGAVNSFRGSGDPPYSAEMEQLLRLQRQRAEAANPLYQAVLQMAMGLMPTAARAGMMQGGAPAMAPASVHGGRRG